MTCPTVSRGRGPTYGRQPHKVPGDGWATGFFEFESKDNSAAYGPNPNAQWSTGPSDGSPGSIFVHCNLVHFKSDHFYNLDRYSRRVEY